MRVDKKLLCRMKDLQHNLWMCSKEKQVLHIVKLSIPPKNL